MLETVKIVHGDSYLVINESDFDSEKHTLYVEPEAPTPENSTIVESGSGKPNEAPTPAETQLSDEGLPPPASRSTKAK
jgi:hypothetical protein